MWETPLSKDTSASLNTDHLSLAAIVMQLIRVECYEGCITCDDESEFTRTCVYAFIPHIFSQLWGWRLSLWITSGRKDLHSVSVKRELLRVKPMEQFVFPFMILDSSKSFYFVRPVQSQRTWILFMSSYCKSDIYIYKWLQEHKLHKHIVGVLSWNSNKNS